MPALSWVASFAALGLGTRCYQLAIMKRGIFDNLGGHALSMGAFGAGGYYLYHTNERNEELLAQKRDRLQKMREVNESKAADSEGSAH